MENNKYIELDHGGGGQKSNELIAEIRKIINITEGWTNQGDDAACFDLAKTNPPYPTPPAVQRAGLSRGSKLLFTTDAFIVDPLFFPGGDIGKIAICGTINDLAVMGATPIGIGLSLVIEEGFPMDDLKSILKSIQKISKETGVPIVTGDTKVTGKGKIDKIEITTSGVGLADNVINNGGAQEEDFVISSGNLGEHAVALLATRFNYQTKIKSDCQPLIKEIASVKNFLNAAKDPTRGGLAEVLNEIAEKSKLKIVLDESSLPYARETEALSNLLGIDKFSFPSEGRFVGTVSPIHAKKAVAILQKFNKDAKIIGQVEEGKGVYLKTELGSLRRIEMPKGKMIPRIC